MLRTTLVTCVLLGLVAACGGGSPSATATPGPVATPPPGATAGPTQTPAGQPQATPTAPPAAGATGVVVHVVVGSGPQAGTYDSTGVKEDCNTSAGGSGATYVDTTKTVGVSGLTFSSAQGGTSPTMFYFDVLFGAISATQPVLEVSTLDPSTPNGTGSASLEDKGATIKWSINATTKDGIGITATIECGPVDRR